MHDVLPRCPMSIVSLSAHAYRFVTLTYRDVAGTGALHRSVMTQEQSSLTSLRTLIDAALFLRRWLSIMCQ